MENHLPCNTCSVPEAGRCLTCRSAAYCSAECQQTDWPLHRLLCKAVALAMDSRPSLNHSLVIYLPMNVTKPSLRWVSTMRNEKHGIDYFHHDSDHLFHFDGSQGYVGRDVHVVWGNSICGRKENKGTIDIWYLDTGVANDSIEINRVLHDSPSPLHDIWDQMKCKAPIVITMKQGSTCHPRRVKDVHLMAFRVAIDFLSFYRDGYGSITTGIGESCPIAKGIISERLSKVSGWRLNCVHDQAIRSDPDMQSVLVPGSHPLFIYENDDTLQIPKLLDYEWVGKAYDPKPEAAVVCRGGLTQG